MSRTRVVVTGMGTTNPVGGDVPSTWDALVNGRSGVRHIEADWAEELAGQDRRHRRGRADRGPRAGQGPPAGPDRAVRDGRGDGGLGRLRPGRRRGRPRQGPARRGDGLRDRRRHHPAQQLRRAEGEGAPSGLPARRADADAERVGGERQPPTSARGPRSTPRSRPARPATRRSRWPSTRSGSAAPTSSLAGGTEAAIHPLNIAAFANMMALSKNAGRSRPTVSRPWDTARDGFVLGEGAGVLVLESEEHAKARGAKIYAEVLGAGITADSHDIAQPDPAGRGGSRAILRALAESEIGPEQIFHVNAHATSTPQGDIAEGLMLHATLGSHVDQVVVTSTKSMTGHLLGGAGALEAVATVLAIQNRVVPPTINLDDQDPAGRARHRHQGPRPAGRRHRGPQQLLRVRRRQRRRRLRERLTGRDRHPGRPSRQARRSCRARRTRATRSSGSPRSSTRARSSCSRPTTTPGCSPPSARSTAPRSWRSAPTRPPWVARWATSAAASWSTPTTGR